MNLQSIYLLLLPAFMLVSGCSDSEQSEPELVPIELRASERGEVATKADEATEVTEAFKTTIFASKRDGDYTGLTSDEIDNEWMKDAEVAIDGKITLTDGTSPTYPKYGNKIYLVAVAPQSTSYDRSTGTVTYQLDGQTDLMYASQIEGQRWDGDRFSSNTNGTEKPLIYRHLLTQLTFKAQKKTADGLTVKVKSISVAGAGSVTLNLSDGTTEFATNTKDLKYTLPDDGKDINDTDAASLDGCLLLPPLDKNEAYKLTVETSVGTFKDLAISFDSASGSSGSSDHFAPGYSYEISLEISDRELEVLSVSVAPWTTVAQDGELDLID